MAFQLKTAAFAPNGRIPDVYTCEGEDVPPPLAWNGAPAGTKSFALIVDDPDAPGRTFCHWAIFDISPTVTSVGGAPFWPVPKASSDKQEFVVGLGRRRSPALATRLGASEPRPVVKNGDRLARSLAPPAQAGPRTASQTGAMVCTPASARAIRRCCGS